MSTTNQLPTLRPGDSHMESLIGAALQGHANTREAMRWLVRQLVPATQTAEVTDSEIIAVMRDGNNCTYNDEAEHIQFARAILALRPAAVPLTDEEATAMIRETVRGNTIRREGSTSLQIVRATEAYYGIKPKERNAINSVSSCSHD